MNDVVVAYQGGGELGRMTAARNGVEWRRSCELLTRWLPPPPGLVADIGGGPGEYSDWLQANHGFGVRLFDVTPLHVDVARRRGITAQVADARRIPVPDNTFDAVLLMGPLYHLADAGDRAQALAEAYRIAKPGAVLVAAALSRWARPFVRAAAGHLGDPAWHEHTLATMRDGRAPGDGWDDIVFLHGVEDLAAEIGAAGFGEVTVAGVEGPIGPWARLDPALNDQAVELAREAETALAACSIHLLAKGIRQ